MPHPMMWVFAGLIVLALAGVAMVAAGFGEPMAPSYDDRPDALAPANRPVAADDLRRVRFSLAFRGYRMSEVDALLARLADEMEHGSTEVAPELGGASDAEVLDDAGVQQLLRAEADKFVGEYSTSLEPLDFGVASAERVESLIAQWARDAEVADPAKDPTGPLGTAEHAGLWSAGVYLGEILIQALPRARWVFHLLFESTPVVQMPDGNLENPIGKALDRYEGDESDSVAFFVEAALAAQARP